MCKPLFEVEEGVEVVESGLCYVGKYLYICSLNGLQL